MKINKIYKKSYDGDVFNLNVRDNHNYFANNLLVSNCHEESTSSGLHGDLDNLINLIKDLPKGTELALGGGNPLSHPNLVPFLEVCKELGIICNITINFKHILPFSTLLNDLINKELVYGVGISISDNSNLSHLTIIENRKNIVFHIIAGVESIKILDKIKESEVKKVLILGYKEFGRGVNFYNSSVEECKKEWFNEIHKYIKKMHLSFDNLSVKQLEIKRFLTDEEWKSFFMGEDGQFTMYIDAVKEEFAISSTSSSRFPILKNKIDFIFSFLRS